MLSHSTSSKRQSTYYLMFCMIVVSSIVQRAVAQELNPSHRVIEGMPQDLSSLHSQLNFLKQLQQLGQIDPQQFPLGNQDSSTGKNPLENLDPELLKQLQKAAEQMGQQSPSNGERKSGTNQDGSSNPSSSSDQDPFGNQKPFDHRELPQNQEEQQQKTLESMLESLSERMGLPLDEMLKQAQERGEAQSPQRDEINNTRDSSNEQNSPTDNPRIRPARRPDRPFPREPNDDNNQPPTSQNEKMPEITPNGGRPGQQQSTGSSSTTDPDDITEFNSDILKQLDRLTNRNSGDDSPRQQAEDAEKIAKLRELLKSRGEGTSPTDSDALPPVDVNDAAQNVLEELRESPASMREKLRSIMDYAKQQSQGSPSETTSGEDQGDGGLTDATAPAGLKSALTKALESTAKQMFEDAEKLPKKESQQLTSRPQKPRSKRSESRFKAWEKATTAMMSSIAKAPPPTPNSPDSPHPKANSPAKPRDWQDFPFLPLLALFGGAFLAWLALFFLRQKNAYTLNAAAIKALPDEMQNREDIIHAFHTIVGRTIAPTENWWPHRRAAEAVGTSSPKVKYVMDSLCSVYESARYLPDDYKLSAEQLATARTAVATIKAQA